MLKRPQAHKRWAWGTSYRIGRGYF